MRIDTAGDGKKDKNKNISLVFISFSTSFYHDTGAGIPVFLVFLLRSFEFSLVSQQSTCTR